MSFVSSSSSSSSAVVGDEKNFSITDAEEKYLTQQHAKNNQIIMHNLTDEEKKMFFDMIKKNNINQIIMNDFTEEEKKMFFDMIKQKHNVDWQQLYLKEKEKREKLEEANIYRSLAILGLSAVGLLTIAAKGASMIGFVLFSSCFLSFFLIVVFLV